MQSCVDRLISINNPCGSSGCTGIYDMLDVPGFTWGKAAGIAEGNFKESTGYQIAQKVRRISSKTVMADLMNELYTRGWATNLVTGNYKTGEFKTNIIPVSTAKRGVQATANSKCIYAGMKLRSITVRGATSLTTTLYILANGVTTSIPITLVANEPLMITNVCSASGAPIFNGESRTITVWIEDVAFQPIEVKPNCHTCQTGTPNPCGNSKGWINSAGTITENKNLAYGIILDLECECNYDSILCAFPNDEMKAQLMKYQCGIQFARLGLETDRFNYFSIYGREELQEYIAVASNGYQKRIKQYAESLRSFLLKNNYCGCISCNGSTTKSLV